jgi:uncharacterized Fe-S center protein
MISNVYFLDFNRMSNTIKEMDKLLEKSIPYIEPGSSIAIKLHIGERGNFTYIRPFFIRKIVDYIKEQKAKPFIAETTVLYPIGYRRNEKEIIETAKYNGFTEEGLGCPIIVADGNDGEDGIEVLSDFPDSPIKSIKVARKIAEANGVIIVSHVKGHVFSGFGGAIKNLAMGCTTRSSKKIQHAAHGIVFNYEKCNSCGKCMEACVFSAIEMIDNRPIRNEDKCMYCGNCIFSCENNAIDIFKDGKERFQIALAYAAACVLRLIKPLVFINFLMDITTLCDCCAPAGNIITHHIGVLASKDPVAIDEASLDLIDSSPLFPGIPHPDPLGKLNGTDSRIQIKSLEKLGMGTREYRLIYI